MAALGLEAARRFPVRIQADVELARRSGRMLATTLGFGKDDVERVVLTVSELATNLVRYAVEGEVLLSVADSLGGRGLRIESRDAGPGIADLEAALRDGESTAGSLGSGLAGVERLMDDMTISSAADGTSIVVFKWLSIP